MIELLGADRFNGRIRALAWIAPDVAPELAEMSAALADLRDDVEQFEIVDELAAALQLADQYCYSNTFIYTQPGNGKVKIKEPKQQLAIAMQKIDSFLQ